MATGRLTRSRSDRMLGGVAAGLAGYLGIDPVLVRVGFVIAGLMGWGILLYLILWVVVPSGEPSTPALRIAEERYARGEISSEDLERIRRDLSSR